MSHTCTEFRAVRKLKDNVAYPTSLELLRVSLAATVFSPEVRGLMEQYKDDISAALGIGDLDPLFTYLKHFWELLQINNSVCTLFIIISFIVYLFVFVFYRHALCGGLPNTVPILS